MKNIAVRTLLIIIIISIPTTIAINYTLPDKQTTNYLILSFDNSKLDQALFYLLPADAQYNSIEIINHKYYKNESQPQSVRFYTTDTPDPNISDCLNNIKTKPYYFDILKKGNFDVVRIFVPSIYHTSSYMYTTTSISLQINYQIKPKSFVTQKDKEKVGTFIENPNVLQDYKITPQTEYQKQDDMPTGEADLLIITDSDFEEIFSNHFRDWKINDDPKIDSIRIYNVSYIYNLSEVEVNGSQGDASNVSNGNSFMPDGKEIHSHYNLFNDTQARIRNFIRYSYDELNTRYVILGGNRDLVPTRMVASYAAGTCPGCSDFYNDTNHACDMYYSALHYCANNNTNSYWMENQVC